MSAQRNSVAVAGGDIDAYCGKCRLTLAHVVVAADGARVVRVLCKTCKSEHNMRKTAAKPKTATKTTKAGSKTAKTGRTAQERSERRAAEAFDAAREGKDLAQAIRYRPSVELTVDDVIDHPTFGLGVVVRAVGDNKVGVIFQNAGERLLVCGRG